MLRPVAYNEYANEITEILSKGAFLTTAANGTVNTMTIAWGSIGFMWGKPVFMIMVRPSRYTHELLKHSETFSVSLPFTDAKEALGICGSRSGRNEDKLAAAGLKLLPGQHIKTPVLDLPGMHYECRIVYQQPMDAAVLAGEQQTKWYANGDYHILYFGEIVASYVNE